MKYVMIAVALAAALPAAAFAEAGDAPTSSASMQGMNMSGMTMAGMNMQKMNCKDMQAMMATNHQMHMSSADMKGMDGCAKGASAAGKPQPGTTPQR